MTAATLERPAGTLKCVVWDLDDTIWDGVLLEQSRVTARRPVVDAIRELDRRGILHSVASRNDPAAAHRELARLGLDEYMLVPEIGWGAKSAAVRRIGETLGIGLDAILFVDDQPFEREEVAASLPQVMCAPAEVAPELPTWPELTPRFVTPESARRRQLYRDDIVRRRAEEEFDGAPFDFLASCAITVEISRLTVDDLQRAEELTVRTHQMNSTGIHVSYEELVRLRDDPRHLALTARLEDKFGSYGTVGLALVELRPERWNLRLLLTSCRVISRGVGGLLLTDIRRRARAAGVTLYAALVRNERNRAMEIAYRFAGLREHRRSGRYATFVDDAESAPEFPSYVTVLTVD